MKLKVFALASLVLATMATFHPSSVYADETSWIGLHEWRVEGRKTCFVGHFHSGTTSGYKRSKRLAMKDAIKSWREFTAAEYGTDWASFKYAANKGAKCERNASGWNCYVEARPCNPKRRGKKRRR